MVEKGIQGGITQAVKRYARANNKFIKDLYNPEEESIYLEYVDANNLYGQAMVQIYQHIDAYERRQRTLPLRK